MTIVTLCVEATATAVATVFPMASAPVLLNAPVTATLPFTSSFDPGLVVPMPTLPVSLINKLDVCVPLFLVRMLKVPDVPAPSLPAVSKT